MAEPPPTGVPAFPNPLDPELETLKKHFEDESYPTLQFAEELEPYRKRLNLSHRVLAAKLGVEGKRSYISKILGLPNRSVGIKDQIKGSHLSERDIDSLKDSADNQSDNHDNQGANQPKTANNHVNQSDNQSSLVDNQSDNHDNQGVNQPKTAKNRVNKAVNEGSVNPGAGIAGEALEQIGGSLLWTILYSLPVVWRLIPWLRSKIFGPKMTIEKRRQVIVWGLAVGALFLFWPRIWQVIKWLNYPAPVMHGPAVSGPLTNGGGQSGVPAVRMLGYDPAHRAILKWDSLGPGFTYHVVYSRSRYDVHYEPIDLHQSDVHTPGALVDFCPYDNKTWYVLLAVAAVDPNGIRGSLSQPVEAEFTSENQFDNVSELPDQYIGGSRAGAGASKASPRKKASSPLASPGLRPPSPRGRGEGEASLVTAGDASNLMKALAPQTPGVAQRLSNALADIAGKAVTAPGAPAPAAPSYSSDVPIPRNLKWAKHPGDRDIILNWDDLGPDFHYNLYASYASDHPKFDRDGHLLRKAIIYWTPPVKGEQVFLFYVTAVDAQGRESAPSERVMADMR